ncbi:hypothetical protein [Paludisphaera sp.]|uniref:hypothetical protein n=1 Tax=Paludisphaera sp. TaxID=2017432 RepID=UPI00301C3DD0
MGRRLVLWLGMALVVACGPTRALGFQADPFGDPVEAQEPAPFTPGEFSAVDEDEPGDLPPARASAPDMEAAPPPVAPSPRFARPAPTEDDAVERVQAPAPAPAPAAAPAAAPPTDADGGFITSAERLPLGRHEAVVNVEVQAPAEMNLNKTATAVIVVANTGSSDVFDVIVRDELPPGLKFVSSSVPPDPATAEQGLLIWRLGTLAAGASKKIPMQVTPTQVVHMDHAATVTFRAGSKARSLVREPKLKVEVIQAPSVARQLKGKTVEYRISVTNTGDGPARDIMVLAKLGPGLRHESLARSEDNSLEHPIDVLGPGDRYDLPPLVVDAAAGGKQTCVVKATSADVVFNAADAEVERSIDVIEPMIKIELAAPEKRYTDTVGQYSVTVENPGTAPARNVRVSVALPVGGRTGKLVKVPEDAVYDNKAQRLIWSIPELLPTNDPANPTSKPLVLPFEVRLGSVGYYEVTAEAKADGVAVERQKRSTDVQGMADLDLLVHEAKRVVDVNNTTMFLIKLKNYGTKEASAVQVEFFLSPNLQPLETSGGPEGHITKTEDKRGLCFPVIPQIAPGATVVLGIKVNAEKADEGIGTCEVNVKQADTAAVLKGMANVKITEGRRTAGAAEPDVK